jgi:hypothetical protein
MSNIDSVADEIEKSDKKKFTKPEKDQRYWSPTRDDAGNGYAVIRFLPTPQVDGSTGKLWVQIWDHGFHGPRGKKGPWYIEKSLTTINRADPVSEYNSKLWNSGVEANKDIARAQKRRLKYHSNILVIKDPANPENEGKVFLFAYGKKIFEKLKEAMKPSFPTDPKFNPFDFWGGADFNLKVRMGSNGYPTYESSSFSNPSELFGGDEKRLSEIWKQEYSLNDLLDPKHFKSYEDLKSSLERVLELTQTSDHHSTDANVQPTTKAPDVLSVTSTKDASLKTFEELLRD